MRDSGRWRERRRSTSTYQRKANTTSFVFGELTNWMILVPCAVSNLPENQRLPIIRRSKAVEWYHDTGEIDKHLTHPLNLCFLSASISRILSAEVPFFIVDFGGPDSQQKEKSPSSQSGSSGQTPPFIIFSNTFKHRGMMAEISWAG